MSKYRILAIVGVAILLLTGVLSVSANAAEAIADYEEIGESSATTYMRWTPRSCEKGIVPNPNAYTEYSFDICLVRGFRIPTDLYLVVSHDSYYSNIFVVAVPHDGEYYYTHIFNYGKWAGEVSYVHYLGYMEKYDHIQVSVGEVTVDLELPPLNQ